MSLQTLEKFLVDNWRDAPKWLSFWLLVLVGCAPELYDLAIQFKILDAGYPLPALIAKFMNIVGFIGAAGRVINQAAVARGLLNLLPSKKADDTSA